MNKAVIIGDPFNNTLGLIRSLGEAHVNITLLLVGKGDRLFVSKSRYLKKGQVFHSDNVEIVCLDLEGVLVPEIWIAFAEETGIPELKRTTRDDE